MGILDSLGHALMDNDRLHFSPSPSQDPGERWLVTLSAPLSAFNGDWIDDIATGKEEEVLREGVQEMWNVRDRASFEQTVQWLVTEGHRAGYEPIWRAVMSVETIKRSTPGALRMILSMTFPAYYQMKAARQINYQQLAQGADKTVQEVAQALTGGADLVDDVRDDLGVEPEQIHSLVAWDAVRLVSLTRWAVQLGYINEDEFMRYASGLAQQVRDTYTGWAQVSAAYVIAGYVWNPAESRRENLTRTNRMLIKEAQSPYRKVAWR